MFCVLLTVKDRFSLTSVWLPVLLLIPMPAGVQHWTSVELVLLDDELLLLAAELLDVVLA
jgi:hypothetical protein